MKLTEKKIGIKFMKFKKNKSRLDKTRDIIKKFSGEMKMRNWKTI